MGHASIRVTKDVYGHLMPRSRQRAATAMEGVLFTADVRPDPVESAPLAAQMAAIDPNPGGGMEEKLPLIRPSVRPSGFEPETCGLRVRCSAVELRGARGSYPFDRPGPGRAEVVLAPTSSPVTRRPKLQRRSSAAACA